MPWITVMSIAEKMGRIAVLWITVPRIAVKMEEPRERTKKKRWVLLHGCPFRCCTSPLLLSSLPLPPLLLPLSLSSKAVSPSNLAHAVDGNFDPKYHRAWTENAIFAARRSADPPTAIVSTIDLDPRLRPAEDGAFLWY